MDELKSWVIKGPPNLLKELFFTRVWVQFCLGLSDLTREEMDFPDVDIGSSGADCLVLTDLGYGKSLLSFLKDNDCLYSKVLPSPRSPDWQEAIMEAFMHQMKSFFRGDEAETIREFGKSSKELTVDDFRVRTENKKPK